MINCLLLLLWLQAVYDYGMPVLHCVSGQQLRSKFQRPPTPAHDLQSCKFSYQLILLVVTLSSVGFSNGQHAAWCFNSGKTVCTALLRLCF